MDFFPEKLRFWKQSNTLNSYFDSTQQSNTLIHSINQNNESSRVHDKNKQKTKDIQDEEEEDEPGRRRNKNLQLIRAKYNFWRKTMCLLGKKSMLMKFSHNHK